MVTIFPNSKGDTLMFKDGEVRVIRKAWDICPMARDCPGALESETFEQFCDGRYEGASCGYKNKNITN